MKEGKRTVTEMLRENFKPECAVLVLKYAIENDLSFKIVIKNVISTAINHIVF
jgi:SRSO17 transposase